MAIPSPLVAFVLFVSFSVFWFAALTAPTSVSRARMRTKLWKLRDEIYDNLVLGRPRNQSAMDLIEAVTVCIRQSEHWTVVRVSTMYLFWKQAGCPRPAGKLDLAPHDNDTALIKEYKERLAEIGARSLVTNSLFGWVVIVVALAVASIRDVVKSERSSKAVTLRPPTEVARRPVRVDLQAEAWADRSAADRRNLISV
jgi:hypothetical protein